MVRLASRARNLFAAAGCTTVIIGFESISEATLLDMDKKVNFCLSYPDAIERIHSRGMSIVGNFVVGFDTDTLAVFEDILQFVDDNHILYPFFSILTPMPGTKLHEDFKADDRLDHYDWARYDTRHVVYEPKHMSRDQLMDGYHYLYEQAYASERALNRLESYWKRYRTTGSSFVERTLINRKLRPFQKEGADRFRWLLEAGWRRLVANKSVGDVGQILYYLDSGHFVDFLDRYRSDAYEDNTQIFVEAGAATSPEDEALARKQWEWKKLQVAQAAG